MHSLPWRQNHYIKTKKQKQAFPIYSKAQCTVLEIEMNRAEKTHSISNLDKAVINNRWVPNNKQKICSTDLVFQKEKEEACQSLWNFGKLAFWNVTFDLNFYKFQYPGCWGVQEDLGNLPRTALRACSFAGYLGIPGGGIQSSPNVIP